MKVKVLLLIATVASLFALFAAQGIIIDRNGGPGSQGIIPAGPQAQGLILQRSPHHW